ncbi:hypothetical protein D3C78_1923160 [compost metagenome]
MAFCFYDFYCVLLLRARIANPRYRVFTKDNNVNVMTLLEIALQLLPEDEMELLDDLCKSQL